MPAITSISRRVLAVACLAPLVAACGSTNVTASPASPAASATEAAETTSEPPVTAPPPTPIGSTTDAPPCGPPDVAVDVNGLGATGSILLVIKATNRGTSACAIDGPPTSIGLRAGGGSLPITYQAHADPFPGDTPDQVAPPVVLAPGASATAQAIWRNWCLGPADVSTVWVGFRADAIDAHPEPAIPPARCDNENAESTLEGFPFEADTGGG